MGAFDVIFYAHYSFAPCFADIDECANDLDNCHERAFCTDIDGDYECTCFEGFSGNGKKCSGREMSMNLDKNHQKRRQRNVVSEIFGSPEQDEQVEQYCTVIGNVSKSKH